MVEENQIGEFAIIFNRHETDQENIEGLIDEAMEAKIGARGFTKSVMETFLVILKDIGNNPGKYDKFVFGGNIVKDNTDYKLIPKKVKVKALTAEG